MASITSRPLYGDAQRNAARLWRDEGQAYLAAREDDHIDLYVHIIHHHRRPHYRRAIAVQRMWPHRRLTSVTLVLWVITGLGKVAVGLVPENTNTNLHLLTAFNIPVGCVAILLSLSIRHINHAVRVTGIVLAVIGLAGTVLSPSAESAGSSLYLGLGAGGMERVADYSGSLWLLMMGIIAVLSAGPHVGDRAAPLSS